MTTTTALATIDRDSPVGSFARNLSMAEIDAYLSHRPLEAFKNHTEWFGTHLPDALEAFNYQTDRSIRLYRRTLK